MSYKEKPQIKLYKYENNAFSLVAIIDDYSECSWENNRFQAGVFSISINYNIPNALLFAEKLWVQFGNNSYSFGEINKITDRIGADGKGSQIRTITGYDARYIFKRRIIKSLNSENTWSMTAKGEICMRSLIADQCGSGAEAKRRLPVVNTIPAVNDAIGSVYSVSESFTNLYEVLRTIATQTEIGWRIRFDGELTLEFYEGEDRRETVRFDTNYDSLQDGEFTDSLESYANSILISGKGTGADRDLYEGETGTPQGLDRFEAYSNQSEMTTEEEYEAQAQSMLRQYGQTLTVSGNGLAKCPYIYGEQYDVGDIITVSFSGKSAVVQILSVTEHWRNGAYDITFSFGKPQNTLSEQLQIMLRKIQQASDKTTATSSVKWYTIPTDTAMGASDVVYDTIGFTGDCGSGATFTLYLDDESTGAKEYNVYFKNLSGGKITLTTGKTGAENAVMNSGTYVARVYVDPQGNITVQSATATSVIASGNNQPATSDGVAGAISAEEYARNMAIANAIKPVMRPKDDFGVASTLAQFEALLVSGTEATACCGSQEITDGPAGDLWYCFIYIPHRNGIGGDNYSYGVLVLYVMTVDTSKDMWIIHHINNDWKSPIKICDVVDVVTSGNMNAVTSNAVAEKLKYKNEWETRQIVETNMFFNGNRLKNYSEAITSISSSSVTFVLPEVPVNIIDVHISATDGDGNVICDGYYDAGIYTLRWAYFVSRNSIVVSWTGWGQGVPNLTSVTLFITYR